MDYKYSRDNYYIGKDGKAVLDLYCQSGSLALGYNHDYMLDAVSSTAFDQYLLQKPAANYYPPIDYYSLIRQVLGSVAPQGMSEIVLCGTGHASAVELALRAAYLAYNETHPGTLAGQGVTALVFENASHGVSMCGLSLSKSYQKSPFLPSLDVITAPFPVAKLPLGYNEVENTKAEKEILKMIEAKIAEQESKKPVAAILVEPIQHKGNYFASRNFYRDLRKLASDKGIPFILDETHTGCGVTGKMWASDHWMMSDRADFIVFGKKTQVSGYFTKPELRPKQPWEIADCWNDVGWKLVQCEVLPLSL